MSIPRIEKADSGFFYARWTDGRRSKRKSMGTQDPAVAKARFAQWLLIDGHRLADTSKGFAVAEVWAAYDGAHVAALAAPDTARYAWQALAPHFATLATDQVPEAVPGYIAARGRKVRGSTIRRELVTLRACLNWAAGAKGGRRLIEPVAPFRLPPDGNPRDRWLTDAEIDKLLAASDDPRITLFMRVALETAGRKSALLDLTWDRVDFETKVIHLEVPDRQRTKKRRASVPISPNLLPHLEEAWRGRRGNSVFGAGDVYQQVVRIAALAGVKGATPNVFRHTAATKMARRGVPLWIIAKILGNSLEIVERTYAKHEPADLRDAVSLISGGG